MIYLYIYLTIFGLFFFATLIEEYCNSADKGEGRCITIRDVLRFLVLTQIPILNIVSLAWFLEHLYTIGVFNKLLNIKLYKERV